MAPPSTPPMSPPQDQHEPSSPSHTPSSPNPNSPKPVQSVSPPTKAQPLPWTNQETVNLIQSYQEKWYSHKRGQLKAGQWEEVAVTVAARCGYDEPSKTSTQCRHKMEKLRKRYRAEKQKPNPHAWEYFDLMDQLERGPLPISAQPIAMVQYQSNDDDDDYENHECDLAEEVGESKYSKRNKSKSVNRIVHEAARTYKGSVGWKSNGLGGSVHQLLQKAAVEKRKERSEESDGEDEDEGGGLVYNLALEIKGFAERLVKMESKKMEIMRETEMYRVEMENKRMKMIVESQRKVLDTIGRAFGSQKKLKI